MDFAISFWYVIVCDVSSRQPPFSVTESVLKAVQAFRSEMDYLAEQLPEYDIVIDLFVWRR